MTSASLEFRRLPDAAAVACEAAARVLERARRAIAAGGRFRLVLAGGSTPIAAYRLLAGAAADWSAWEVFFGDEYRVLRGGSFATRTGAIRGTFRNWDYPIRRQIFAGFRCARDADGEDGA